MGNMIVVLIGIDLEATKKCVEQACEETLFESPEPKILRAMQMHGLLQGYQGGIAVRFFEERPSRPGL